MFDALNYVLGPCLYCCDFLMVVSCWRRRLQCIGIVWSFLRLLKQHKLVVGKLDLSGGGSYSVSRCQIKFTLEYPFKLSCGL